MEPRLYDRPYAFRSDGPTEGAFALIREDEGETVIAEDADGGWARISLTIHSSLAAVGLTAAISTALAKAGISANVVAGHYHDHIFVPWDRRIDAMAVLNQLSGDRS
ncbi:transporter [Sphingomonas sp. DBB INV C78]